MSSTLPPSQVTPAIPAVAIVVDSSFTLAREWRRILIEYCTPLFARLAEGHSAFPQLRLGFVTYGPPDCDGTPVFVNRFFAVGVHNELKETSRLAIGSTNTGGSLGMAALDGYAAAIEMFDTLKSGVNQKPLRPLSLNESRDRPKEVFSYHLWHFAAGQPDDAKHPRWNRSPALDSLTWKTVPAELKKREINCSMLLVSPSPKFSKLFSDISDARLAPWFPTRPNHTILLSGFAPSPKPRAAVPSTIPAKRPAESPAEQRSPGPKISKPSSQTASPALSAAKKPLPQSSPLIASATASSAPPSSSATSPSVPPATAPNSSPPKPPPREPSNGAVIDLTQPSTEVVPATMQSGRAPPPQPNPLQQTPPTTQPQPQTTQPPTPQSQGQSSMQPQPQPSSFALNLKPTASADPMEMLTKLKQVEMRIAELRNKQLEAAQAGRTEDANKLTVVLSQHIAAYKKGREFVVKMLEAKRAAAAAQGQAQGQGSSQSAHDPTSTAGTTQHSTPTMAATPQPQLTPNTNPRSTPRLAATPLMAANPNPMSAMNPSPSHVSTNSGVSVGSGSAANANAALLQAFNPAATQIPAQSGLAGLSGSDAHSLTTMQQHGLPHNNNLGQQPMTPALAAQMRKLVEQRGLAQNGQTLIPGNNAGINGATGAPAAPTMPGGFSETRDVQWVGTFVWQGTDTARNEKKEVRAQIVAIAPTGNPMASTWPKVLNLSPAGPAVPMNELQEWLKRTQPVLMRVQPTPGTDDHGFGQLVKLLRERSFYAITGWEIPGTGRTTTNLLIAPFSGGLLGAAFPVNGMPEMPKARVVPPQPLDPATVRLDPAVRQAIFNMLPQQLRSFPEPQLSHIISQLFIRQQQRTQNAAALSQQHQQAQQQQQQQQQAQQQQQQQQQQQTQPQPDRFPQNPGVNMAANGSMFGNLALKQGELNPFVPGSQANAIASGLMIQPSTSLEQLQQRQQQAQQQQQAQAQAQQQQAQAQQQQQQHQQAQQNQQRAILDMQRVLSSGGLGAGVGGGLGGGLMNTGAGGGGLGMSGGLGANGPGFGNGNGVNGMAGAGIGLGLSGAGFSALGGATGMDGAGGAGEGLNGMGANAVTMDMFQSFLHRNGEGGQG